MTAIVGISELYMWVPGSGISLWRPIMETEEGNGQ